jgi:hypothetical protein
MLPFFIAILIFSIAAFLYYHGRIRISLFFILSFYGLNAWLATEVFLPQHKIIFAFLLAIFALFPLALLLSFFLDTLYGWFIFDMSYSWAFVWGFGLLFFGINLVGKTIPFFLG